MKKHHTTILTLCASFGTMLSASAELRMPSIFSDHMVLQRNMDVPVWGWADPNAKVTVSFNAQKVSAKADKQGKWEIKLKPLKANKKPSTLKISTSKGDKHEIEDILVGEVWIASGQSNMEWAVRQSRKEDIEIVRKETVPQLRLFAIPKRAEYTNQDNVPAKWTESSPNHASNFSAVAWFFGKKLHDELDVPVGMIRSAWGGSFIEPWITQEGFQSVKSLKKLYGERRAQTPGNPEYAKAQIAYVNELKKWHQQAKQSIAKKEYFPPVPKQPTTLAKGHRTFGTYEAMIHPIVPFAVKGFIWYQGESNNGDGMLYTEKKKALIGGWRKAFQNPEAPFHFVQIAPYNYGRRGNLPELQFAQQQCLYQIPNTGMVVTNDISNIKDIHPRNKSDVGNRLALWALAKDYGQKDLVYSGPLYKKFTVKGSRIAIQFDSAKGLKTRDGEAPTHFEIADDSENWVKAEAKIQNDAIILSSDEVKKPTRARFAWDQLAEPNLCNGANLPAGCFHTHWPSN